MPTRDHFRLRYAGELREALIMIEGDDGAFELLEHGVLPGAAPENGLAGVPYALIRSSGTSRTHLLARDDAAVRFCVNPWRRIAAAPPNGSA